MSHSTDSHCHNLLCDLLAQQPSVSLTPHITKSLLPKDWRVSSPESDSGVAFLTPVASHGAFSSHHVTESQEGLQLPERDTLSSVSGDTSPSSPSKSDHDTEDASCHHQATKKTLHEKGMWILSCFSTWLSSDITNTSTVQYKTRFFSHRCRALNTVLLLS